MHLAIAAVAALVGYELLKQRPVVSRPAAIAGARQPQSALSQGARPSAAAAITTGALSAALAAAIRATQSGQKGSGGGISGGGGSGGGATGAAGGGHTMTGFQAPQEIVDLTGVAQRPNVIPRTDPTATNDGVFSQAGSLNGSLGDLIQGGVNAQTPPLPPPVDTVSIDTTQTIIDPLPVSPGMDGVGTGQDAALSGDLGVDNQLNDVSPFMGDLFNGAQLDVGGSGGIVDDGTRALADDSSSEF